MKNIYILAVAALVLSLGSCTIEKRHYQSGYHVEWNHRNKGIDKAEEVKVNTPSQEMTAAAETTVSPETTPVAENAIVPATVVQSSEQTTATLQEEPVFTSKSTTQKLTERAESVSTKIEANENENQSQTNDTQRSSNGKGQVSDALLVILCILIPPLAVYLYESDITTNFWVDLLLSVLFWLPGMIFAFLVCFADVSL